MIPRSTAPQGVQEVYSTVEFDRWVGRAELDADEAFLVDHYLQPGGSTLEAGTGGGRILLGLRRLGFTHLRGFDFVPGLIEKAREADAEGGIAFDVQDAGRLAYADNTFDQAIYLQQLLSCIDADETRRRAMQEAFRVVKPGGTVLFSVLSYEVRRQSALYRGLMGYWRMLRWLRGSRTSVQATPWMRLGDRFNPSALWDRGPHVYWFRMDELMERLGDVGFEVRAVGTSAQIKAGALVDGVGRLRGQRLNGAFYCVCRKRATSGSGDGAR